MPSCNIFFTLCLLGLILNLCIEIWSCFCLKTKGKLFEDCFNIQLMRMPLPASIHSETNMWSFFWLTSKRFFCFAIAQNTSYFAYRRFDGTIIVDNLEFSTSNRKLRGKPLEIICCISHTLFSFLSRTRTKSLWRSFVQLCYCPLFNFFFNNE